MKKPLALWALVVIAAFPLAHESRAASATEEYDLVERCGRQAQALWQSEYLSIQLDKADSAGRWVSYENHYSKKLNKCYFMDVIHAPQKGQMFLIRTLLDLNDRKKIANHAGFDGGSTRSCEVLGKKCSSKAEWDQLIQPYWED